MKNNLSYEKLYIVICILFIALSGCEKSEKTGKISEPYLQGYKELKFGTPIWKLVSEKKCQFSINAQQDSVYKILFENTENDIRIEELQQKAKKLSADEKIELATLEKLAASAISATKEIEAMAGADFLKECYKDSDKLFGVSTEKPISGLGKTIRDVCDISLYNSPVTCEIKSEFNPNNKDYVEFESDTKGRLITIRVSLGETAGEYKDALEVIKKLQKKYDKNTTQEIKSAPPKIGEVIQWTIANNQILATWTAQTKYAGDLELVYQNTNDKLTDSAIELYNQVKIVEIDGKQAKSKELIFRLNLLAAERGHPAAQFAAGKMYQLGEGVTKNIPRSVLWLQKSSDQGNLDAQRQLGTLLIMGEEVERNAKAAFELFSKAANKNDSRAMVLLGLTYSNGDGVKQDYHMALKWFSKAAEQNDFTAQTQLGWLYYNGFGVPQDYPEAAKWYRMAADQGFHRAQFNLGTMYENGRGVQQDVQEALKWYRKAAAQGNKEAEERLR